MQRVLERGTCNVIAPALQDDEYLVTVTIMIGRCL
jgi:hypothetical protein